MIGSEVSVAEYVESTYNPEKRVQKEQLVLRAVLSTRRERERRERRGFNNPIHLLPQFCFAFGSVLLNIQ